MNFIDILFVKVMINTVFLLGAHFEALCSKWPYQNCVFHIMAAQNRGERDKPFAPVTVPTKNTATFVRQAKKYSLPKEALAICQLVHLLNKEFNVLFLRSLRQRINLRQRPHYKTHAFEKGALRKRSSNRRNLNTPAFRFREDGKFFKNGAFQHDSHVISLAKFCSTEHKSKMTGGTSVFKFPRRCVYGDRYC